MPDNSMTPQPVAVIFGVSGQDGAYLAHLLLGKGYAVHGVSRDADASSFQRLARIGIRDKVTLHSGDLSRIPQHHFPAGKNQSHGNLQSGGPILGGAVLRASGRDL